MANSSLLYTDNIRNWIALLQIGATLYSGSSEPRSLFQKSNLVYLFGVYLSITLFTFSPREIRNGTKQD
jgi:hypothetical protein